MIIGVGKVSLTNWRFSKVNRRIRLQTTKTVKKVNVYETD